LKHFATTSLCGTIQVWILCRPNTNQS